MQLLDSALWCGVVTLFPRMFDTLQEAGVIARAICQLNLVLDTFNPRDYVNHVSRTVDDAPYGGGPGMVLQAYPLDQATCAARQRAQRLNRSDVKVILLSPQGTLFSHQKAKKISQYQSIIFVCGRYEGVDQRFIDQQVDEEYSIGDYVLSGGELAAMVMIDACIRLRQGILGNAQSADADSFSNGLLEHPHFTRPEIFNDAAVPPILLSGNHQQIAAWRKQQSLGRTWLRRPDLLESYELDREEQYLLTEFIAQYRGNESS